MSSDEDDSDVRQLGRKFDEARTTTSDEKFEKIKKSFKSAKIILRNNKKSKRLTKLSKQYVISIKSIAEYELTRIKNNNQEEEITLKKEDQGNTITSKEIEKWGSNIVYQGMNIRRSNSRVPLFAHQNSKYPIRNVKVTFNKIEVSQEENKSVFWTDCYDNYIKEAIHSK